MVITLASKEAGTHGRTKHFTGRINYLIDNVKNGIIRLEYLRTEDQKADGLTKPFGLKAQEKFRGDLMGKQMHGSVEKKIRRVKGESYHKVTTLVRLAAGTKAW